MRKRLLAGLGLVTMLAAGCDGGAAAPPTETGSPPSAPAPTSEAKSKRSASVKAVSVSDKCSIIAPPQQKALGAEKPPEELTSGEEDGCRYQQGELGAAGWQMFIAVNDDKSYADMVKIRPNPTKETQILGYPVSVYEDNSGCVLFADISDDGYLIANTTQLGTEDPGIDLCQHGEKFIEAAVKNLPDA